MTSETDVFSVAFEMWTTTILNYISTPLCHNLKRVVELFDCTTDQGMYFDDYRSHEFNVLNLQGANQHPMTLQRLGSLTPFAIAVDANFIYLSNQYPRCAITDMHSGGHLSSVLGVQAWGHLSPSTNPPLFLSLVWILQGSLTAYQRVWGESAHPLPNILMQFMQSNCLVKSTLMFNVLQKSAYMQSSATVGRTILWITGRKKCSKKWGICAQLDPTASSGAQDPKTPQDRRHWICVQCCNCAAPPTASTGQCATANRSCCSGFPPSGGV